MKSFQKLIAIILLMPFLACTRDGSFKESVNKAFVESMYNNRMASNRLTYSENELIVQYEKGLSEEKKNDIRKFCGVISFEVCKNCLDKDIEKWGFENEINIEHKKLDLEQTGGGGGIEGIKDIDYEFTFSINTEDIPLGLDEEISPYPFLKSENTGVTIAVLDTGLDLDFSAFLDVDNTPLRILYNASETAADGEYSGYDFVNHDNNTKDDNPGRHGTQVSIIIKEILNYNNIPFQMLPVKVCNSGGEASYFDIICGLQYALKRADILQMSLGWYDDGYGDFTNTIFSNLLNEYPKVLVVTSAGNGGGAGADIGNNDIYSHYPSSFSANNIVAVAATNADSSDIAYFSNFGNSSVDFFARGEHLPFYKRDGSLIVGGLSGTSFAAPRVTAFAAKYLYQSGMELTPSLIIDELNTNGLFVHYTKPVKFNKLIE